MRSTHQFATCPGRAVVSRSSATVIVMNSLHAGRKVGLECLGMSKAKAAAAVGSAPAIEWKGVPTSRLEYQAGETIFAQGDPAKAVLFVAKGNVRLSVLSHAGKEAIIAVLDVGHFFGEGCLASQPLRMSTASAMGACSVITVEKRDMVQHLHAHPAFADRFLTHMLNRNIRIEEDLID